MSILKKVFIISTAILAVVLFFWGIYNFAFKNSPPQITAGNVVSNNSAVNPIVNPAGGSENKREAIISVTDEAIIAPFFRAELERIAYYSKNNGNVFEISPLGKDKLTISSQNLNGLQNIFWAPDGRKVISVFNNVGQPSFSFYDYEKKAGSRIKEGLDSIVWSNLGDKIIYRYSDSKTKKQSLNIADPDGSHWQKIADLNFNGIKIAPIPSTALVSFWNYPNAFEETKMQAVSSLGGEVKTLLAGKFGADYLWAPNGMKALVSYSDTKGGSKINLAIMNSQGGEFQGLGIPAMVSKCVWSKNSKKIYCALSGGVEQSSVMPNDYQEGKIKTQDTFWSLDVETGKKDRLVELADMKGGYDASNLFLSPEEDALFFINRLDGKLYRIDI